MHLALVSKTNETGASFHEVAQMKLERTQRVVLGFCFVPFFFLVVVVENSERFASFLFARARTCQWKKGTTDGEKEKFFCCCFFFYLFCGGRWIRRCWRSGGRAASGRDWRRRAAACTADCRLPRRSSDPGRRRCRSGTWDAHKTATMKNKEQGPHTVGHCQGFRGLVLPLRQCSPQRRPVCPGSRARRRTRSSHCRGLPGVSGSGAPSSAVLPAKETEVRQDRCPGPRAGRRTRSTHCRGLPGVSGSGAPSSAVLPAMETEVCRDRCPGPPARARQGCVRATWH